jgi:chromate transport protein ChrA
MHVLFDLFFTFAYLALISVGNSRSVIAEMERQVVIIHAWMSHQAFVEAYALGLLVPGPNMLNVVLIGNHVAGLPGAGGFRAGDVWSHFMCVSKRSLVNKTTESSRLDKEIPCCFGSGNDWFDVRQLLGILAKI